MTATSKTLFVHSYARSSHERLWGIPEVIVFCPITADTVWTDASIEQEAQAVVKMLKARMPASTWWAFVETVAQQLEVAK